MAETLQSKLEIIDINYIEWLPVESIIPRNRIEATLKAFEIPEKVLTKITQFTKFLEKENPDFWIKNHWSVVSTISENSPINGITLVLIPVFYWARIWEKEELWKGCINDLLKLYDASCRANIEPTSDVCLLNTKLQQSHIPKLRRSIPEITKELRFSIFVPSKERSNTYLQNHKIKKSRITIRKTIAYILVWLGICYVGFNYFTNHLKDEKQISSSDQTPTSPEKALSYFYKDLWGVVLTDEFVTSSKFKATAGQIRLYADWKSRNQNVNFWSNQQKQIKTLDHLLLDFAKNVSRGSEKIAYNILNGKTKTPNEDIAFILRTFNKNIRLRQIAWIDSTLDIINMIVIMEKYSK